MEMERRGLVLPPAPAGFHALTRRQLVWTVLGLQLTLLLAALDQTIVTTAMPSVIRQLNGFNLYAWVTTSYLLCSTTAVPIFGKLADLYGRKWIFLAGATLFVAASAVCGMAGWFGDLFGGGMNQLIVFRGVQGVGAGIISAISFTVVGDIAPPAQRGRYLGLLSAVWGVASVLGPTLGGWITDNLSWRWVFYVNMPVGVVAITVVLLAFPYFRPEGVRRVIDYRGVAALVACLVPFLLALTWAADVGWGSPRVVGWILFSVVMLAVFLFVERRAAEPVLPLGLFGNPSISLSWATMFLTGMALFGVVLFLPLFMQAVTGISATRSGTLLTPLTMSMVAGSIASGQFVSRVGYYKATALVGLAVTCLGTFLLARMDANTSQWTLVGYMVLVGVGGGFLMPIYTTITQNAAPPGMMGAATSGTMFFRMIGATAGAAVFGAALTAGYARRFETRLPPDVPATAAEAYRNPLRLVQGEAAPGQGLPAGPPGRALANHVRDSLVFALDRVFLISAAVALLPFILNLFLREPHWARKGHAEPLGVAAEF